MLIGTLTMSYCGKTETEEIVMNRRDVQEELEEFKSKGFKSESVFLLNGNVEVKLYTTVTVPIEINGMQEFEIKEKVIITGTLIESEKNKMFSIYK